MKTHRVARIAEAIREVAAETILFEMHDPRVKMVTVTRAEVSADLQHAKIFISVMGPERDETLTLRGLQHAAGFVQSRLAKRLQTRFTPTVRFVLDKGVKNSIEMSRLIKEALGDSATAADANGPGEPAPAEPTDGAVAEAPATS